MAKIMYTITCPKEGITNGKIEEMNIKKAFHLVKQKKARITDMNQFEEDKFKEYSELWNRLFGYQV